jgi:hypothetical protein
MTMNRPELHRGYWTILAFGAALLSGCAQQAAAPAGPTNRVYAADQLGSAKSCQVEKVVVTDGKTTDTIMKLRNDGGWCAIAVSRAGKPFSSSRLAARPDHGKVYVHQVGDDTRIDYTPTRGFVGADKFTVTLIPGDGAVQVAVTVAGP